MKRKSIVIVFSTCLFFGLWASNLFAQDKPVTPDKPTVQEQPIAQDKPVTTDIPAVVEQPIDQDKPAVVEKTRVIEEALVLSDPTVAQGKKWLVGVSGEYWYVSKNNDRYVCTNDNCSTLDLYAAGTIKGTMPGGTVTVGYDKFTVSYSLRKGSFDAESMLQPNYTSNGSYQPTKGTEDQTEHEITVRLMLGPGSPHFNPYLLVGYNQMDKTSTETLVNPGWTWNVNHNATLKENVRLKAPFVGLGTIIPFNKYLGMRIDGRFLYVMADYAMEGLKWNSTTSTYGGTRAESETLYGFAAVGTFYWAIWKGLNVQAGGKWQYTSQGDGQHYIDKDNKWGAFGMLGYTYKF